MYVCVCVSLYVCLCLCVYSSTHKITLSKAFIFMAINALTIQRQHVFPWYDGNLKWITAFCETMAGEYFFVKKVSIGTVIVRYHWMQKWWGKKHTHAHNLYNIPYSYLTISQQESVHSFCYSRMLYVIKYMAIQVYWFKSQCSMIHWPTLTTAGTVDISEQNERECLANKPMKCKWLANI